MDLVSWPGVPWSFQKRREWATEG